MDTGLSISEQEAHRESASDGEIIQIEHAAKLQAKPFISLLVELHPKNVENDAQKKLGDLNIVSSAFKLLVMQYFHLRNFQDRQDISFHILRLSKRKEARVLRQFSECSVVLMDLQKK